MFLLFAACTPSNDDDTAQSVLDECDAAALFPTLTADPANADYPAPELEAGCDGDELVVRSNGIPWYEFVPLTPNELRAVDNEWRVPLVPVEAEAPTDIPLLGVVAFVLVGLPTYGPNEAEMPDPYGDPVYNQIVDGCGGHTGPIGDYHLHAADTECASMSAPVDGQASPIVGFALDGYPIYGPMGCLDAACEDVVELQSAWNQVGDPSTYAWEAYEFVASTDASVLDRCNGRTQPDGSYGYHLTSGFPYIVGCYHGEVTADEGEAGPPSSDDCGSDCG